MLNVDASIRIPLPDNVRIILQRLAERGHAAYVVGGCVRDSIMGNAPHDWDICTSARPDALAACFFDYPTVRAGMRHGTLGVIIGGATCEITTFRNDGAYADHRHPDAVSFSADIVEDLRRRDFTINAMAYHPDIGLLDPFRGRSDIANGVIRCVGDADTRFCEDALRVLRALRFASTLSFRIEEATAASIHKNAHLLGVISGERIASELNKLLLGDAVHDILMAYVDVIGVPIPEILPCVGFEQNNRYHHLTVWAHICLSVSGASSDLLIRLTMLLHDIAKPSCFSMGEDGKGHFYGHQAQGAMMAETILRRLRYDTDTIGRVCRLIGCHDATLPTTKPGVRRFVNRMGVDLTQKLVNVKRADAFAHAEPERGYARIAAFEALLSEVLRDQDCVSLSDLAIGGDALLRMGVPEGPGLGAILAKLLNEVMDDTLLNEEDALLARARALACENAAAHAKTARSAHDYA